MTTTATTTKTNPAPRILALARAEWLQFLRNKLLLSMLIFPIGMSVLMVSVSDGALPGVALGADMFILFALGFLVYYSALSMATTRRDEKVLKRLRTGEARDWEILGAVAVPLGVLTLVMTLITVIIIAFISNTGVPAVVNPVILVLVLVMGTVLSNALALVTSRFTQNAEAAMITSFPVLILVMLSQYNLRSIFPDTLASIVEWTPFALCVDLFRLGWVGSVEAVDMGEIGSFASTMVDSAPMLAALAAWTLVLSWLGQRYMRWDTHR